MMVVSLPLGIGSFASILPLLTHAPTDPAALAGMLTAALTTGIMISIIGLVVKWLYYTLMESSNLQATVGKMAIGIIVTDLNGKRISFARATGRHFSKYISALIIGVGYLMVAFTAQKQGLHDIIAGTLVLQKPKIM